MGIDAYLLQIGSHNPDRPVAPDFQVVSGWCRTS